MAAQAVGAGDDALRALDEPATVRFTPAAKPLALRWHGSIWQVVGDPVPEPAGVAHARTGATPPAWLFTAQTGPASPVLEFRIGFDARRDEWRLLSVGGTGS
ncbi:hypothetical protein [Arthrobacter sedimenti]|uniref:hypothetical protein n=1 Tax=Arthrobacter sedimenti TaxID=2694931 RepID=UPI000B356815|nr:hypothetical protein [Arthrobacter sedimenti]OUM41800.1 hypothetical protein B8W73_09170 [Arthrobacter agilis]